MHLTTDRHGIYYRVDPVDRHCDGSLRCALFAVSISPAAPADSGVPQSARPATASRFVSSQGDGNWMFSRAACRALQSTTPEQARPAASEAGRRVSVSSENIRFPSANLYLYRTSRPRYASFATASASPAASSTAATVFGSSLDRIFPSISSAISGLLLRNSRTFSLPWPMRSSP